MSLDKMGDVKADQFEASVRSHAKGIEGVAQALEAKPMPPELLAALQNGIGTNDRSRS